MKKILSAVGYNSAYSLLTVTDEKLNALEEYIDKNERDVVDSIDVYKSKKPFAFLPGHRALIFGIKEELLKRSEHKKSKVGHNQRAAGNILNEDDLRIMLRNQLANYGKTIGLKMQHTINDMSVEQTESQTFARTSVSCSICDTINYLRYDKGWKASNIFKHMRTHCDLMNKKKSVGENTKNHGAGNSKAENGQQNLPKNVYTEQTFFVTDDLGDAEIVYDPNEGTDYDED